MRRMLGMWMVVLALGTGWAAGIARAGNLEVETKLGFDVARAFGDVDGARDKTGFAGSMALYVPLQPWLSLQTEFGYAMKGASFGNVDDPIVNGVARPGSFEQLWAVDYVEVPALLRARTGGDMVRTALVGGPVLGFKAVEKFALNGEGSEQYVSRSDLARGFDFAVAGGAALEFGPTDRCLSLEARYTRSLANTLDAGIGGWVGQSDLRFMVGWKSRWNSVFDRL